MRSRERILLLLAMTCVAGVLAAESPAPIALHPDNPHYFLFRGKPTILITSGEHYGAVLNLDFDYVPYLDELQSKGLNLTRTFSGTYREVAGSFNITSNTLAPVNGSRYIAPWPRTDTPGAGDGNKFDLSKFNDEYFKRLKDFVGEAGKRGVVVEYVFFCPNYEEVLWTVGPMNARNNVNGVGKIDRQKPLTLENDGLLEYQQAFVRKVVGELKDFDNLYYEICNEPYFGGVTLDWQRRIGETIVEAEKDFAAKHLIAQNIANEGAKVENPFPMVSIFNFHYANPPVTVKDNYGLNKAIGFDESGFDGIEEAPYRREAWEFIVAGGAVYSNLDYSYTPWTEDGSAKVNKGMPGSGGEALRDQLKLLKDWMHGFDYIRMRPDAGAVVGVPEKSRAWALVEPGKQYAIYIVGGQKPNAKIKLPAGSYKAEWLDPITGKIIGAEELNYKEGGEFALSPAQYPGEIAYKIVRK